MRINKSWLIFHYFRVKYPFKAMHQLSLISLINTGLSFNDEIITIATLWSIAVQTIRQVSIHRNIAPKARHYAETIAHPPEPGASPDVRFCWIKHTELLTQANGQASGYFCGYIKWNRNWRMFSGWFWHFTASAKVQTAKYHVVLLWGVRLARWLPVASFSLKLCWFHFSSQKSVGDQQGL